VKTIFLNTDWKAIFNFSVKYVMKVYENGSELANKLLLKVKLSLCLTKHHAMKMHWGSGGIGPHILDLSTRWR
jgi:hypothetical protein